MADRAPADFNERTAALDVRRSFIVQAPAGSGKTELLVHRYLKLLETVEKPEEIVAITFTKKAAAEMRKRVIEQISPELAPRLRIQTIDALCASLTSRMPVLAKFGAQPGIAEDASELYQEAASRTLLDLKPPVARLLAHLDNNVADATQPLAGMLERRDQWLRSTGQAPTRSELEAALKEERGRRAPAERQSRRNERRSGAEARVELKKRMRPFEKEIAVLEARIAERTKELEAVRGSLADPALYDGGEQGERLKDLAIAEARLTAELARAEEDWLHLQARLDALRREPAA